MNVQITTSLNQEALIAENKKKNFEDEKQFSAALASQLLQNSAQVTTDIPDQLVDITLVKQEELLEISPSNPEVSTLGASNQLLMQTMKIKDISESEKANSNTIEKNQSMAQSTVNNKLLEKTIEPFSMNNNTIDDSMQIESLIENQKSQQFEMAPKRQLSLAESRDKTTQVEKSNEATKLPLLEKSLFIKEDELSSPFLKSEGIIIKEKVTIEQPAASISATSNEELTVMPIAIPVTVQKESLETTPKNVLLDGTQQFKLGSKNEKLIVETLEKNITDTRNLDKEFTIKMNPANLGPVKIQMKVTNQQVDLIFKLQTSQTKELFTSVTKQFIQILDNMKSSEHGKLQLGLQFVSQNNDISSDLTTNNIQSQQLGFDFSGQQEQRQSGQKQIHVNKGASFIATLEKTIDEIHTNETKNNGSVSILA